MIKLYFITRKLNLDVSNSRFHSFVLCKRYQLSLVRLNRIEEGISLKKGTQVDKIYEIKILQETKVKIELRRKSKLTTTLKKVAKQTDIPGKYFMKSLHKAMDTSNKELFLRYTMANKLRIMTQNGLQ